MSDPTPNGAQSLIRTLVDSGVEVCFANPGTSEMHFVAALDEVPGMRAVLGLFEGVVTGAADGYARIAGKPACTLLHLGPGLGNGFANLHNARRAHTPIVNIVGDHATYHKRFDAPLESDIDAVAGGIHLGAPVDDPGVGAYGRRPGGGRGHALPRRGGHADPAGRRLLAGVHTTGRPGDATTARDRAPGGGRRRRPCAAQRWLVGAVSGWPHAGRAGPARSAAHRSGHRRQGVW